MKAVASALALVAAATAAAQGPPDRGPLPGHGETLLVAAVPAAARLGVTTPAFADGGAIPRDATAYGANRFPGLRWTAGPAGTRSYVVVMQGMLPGGGTSIHLTLLNIASDTTELPEGMAAAPAGAVYGINVHGRADRYTGPHTHGSAPQAYHLQVAALDTTLPAAAGASFAALTAAMRGHVLATGEVVGHAAMPADVAAAEARARVPVRIDTGLLSGVSGRDPAVIVYKGIPYAAPPVGPLRWRAPAAAPRWQGVRKADRFGALCPQPVGPERDPGAMSEDCLTANVWTTGTSGGKRPVYVWIYGGGFLNGTGSSPQFDGEALAKKGVVVVTFNYRLGALGFLATPELSHESGHGASGNYGLLDDVALLQWVRRNIASFGGDPQRVTIGGQSAGAGSVGFMALSPLAKGLFIRGIAESHARYPRDPDLRFLSVSYRTLADAEAAGQAYARTHGARTAAELRALPWQEIVRGSDVSDDAVDTGTTAKPPLFRPVVDGWVVPRGYQASLAARAQNDVTIVAGNNRDETGAVPRTAFAALRARAAPLRGGAPEVSVTLADFTRRARIKYGALADDFLRLYPATTDDEAAEASNSAAHDGNRVSTWLWATEWSKGTTRPVYTYWSVAAPPGPGSELRGAYHGAEIPYVFGNLDVIDRPWTDADRQMAQIYSSYWANIIKTGDPNGPGLPEWKPFDPASPTVMRLGLKPQPMPITSPERLAFWKRFYATQAAW